MYTRVQVSYLSRVTGKPCGVFGAAHHLKENGVLSDEEVQTLAEVKSWFEEHLPNPPFYELGNQPEATTWFKANAADMVERLTPLVKMLNRHDVSVEIVRNDCPGVVIYEDNFQIGVI